MQELTVLYTGKGWPVLWVKNRHFLFWDRQRAAPWPWLWGRWFHLLSMNGYLLITLCLLKEEDHQQLFGLFWKLIHVFTPITEVVSISMLMDMTCLPCSETNTMFDVRNSKPHFQCSFLIPCKYPFFSQYCIESSLCPRISSKTPKSSGLFPYLSCLTCLYKINDKPFSFFQKTTWQRKSTSFEQKWTWEWGIMQFLFAWLWWMLPQPSNSLQSGNPNESFLVGCEWLRV
jgi:hypothetical protein